MNQMTRRNFLKVMTVVAASSVGVLAYDRLVLDRTIDFETEPGTLDTDTIDILTAYAMVILAPYPVSDSNHYARYFSYRAQNTNNDRGLYIESATIINTQAEQTFGRPYLQLGDADQRTIAVRLLQTHHHPIRITRKDQVMHLLTGHIVRYYMHTDAYYIFHQDGYPGTPRGLENYRQPPQTTI